MLSGSGFTSEQTKHISQRRGEGLRWTLLLGQWSATAADTERSTEQSCTAVLLHEIHAISLETWLSVCSWMVLLRLETFSNPQNRHMSVL